VILCGHFDAEVLGRIEQAGVAITDRSHAEAGLVMASLDYKGLTAIESIAGLDSVSPDDMQHAL
jgi:hypothetical protein